MLFVTYIYSLAFRLILFIILCEMLEFAKVPQTYASISYEDFMAFHNFDYVSVFINILKAVL